MCKWNYVIGFFLLFFMCAGVADPSIFLITPSTSTVTVRSDSQTSVVYTVTNNSTNLSFDHLQIDAYYAALPKQIIASSHSLTLQNDNCSGATLAPMTSCTFDLLISGSDQANSFTITPSVCANNNQACSSADSSTALTANVISVTGSTYAYYELMPIVGSAHLSSPPTYAILPASTTSIGQLGTPIESLHLGFNDIEVSSPKKVGTPVPGLGALVVSPDGKTVYALETPNSGSDVGDVAVIQGGADPVLLKRISIPGIGFAEASAIAMVTSSDGATLYVLYTPPSADEGAVYAINTSTDVVTTVSSAIAGAPVSLAISPDNKTLYVLTRAGGEDGQGSVQVYDTTNDQLVTMIDNSTLSGLAFSAPNRIAISSGGSKMYVSNIGDTNIVALSISSGNYTLLNAYALSAIPTSLITSADGNYIYVACFDTTDLTIINIATGVMTYLSLTEQNDADLALTKNDTTLFTVPWGGVSSDVVTGLPANPVNQLLDLSMGTLIRENGAFVG